MLQQAKFVVVRAANAPRFQRATNFAVWVALTLVIAIASLQMRRSDLLHNSVEVADIASFDSSLTYRVDPLGYSWLDEHRLLYCVLDGKGLFHLYNIDSRPHSIKITSAIFNSERSTGWCTIMGRVRLSPDGTKLLSMHMLHHFPLDLHCSGTDGRLISRYVNSNGWEVHWFPDSKRWLETQYIYRRRVEPEYRAVLHDSSLPNIIQFVKLQPDNHMAETSFNHTYSRIRDDGAIFVIRQAPEVTNSLKDRIQLSIYNSWKSARPQIVKYYDLPSCSMSSEIAISPDCKSFACFTKSDTSSTKHGFWALAHRYLKLKSTHAYSLLIFKLNKMDPDYYGSIAVTDVGTSGSARLDVPRGLTWLPDNSQLSYVYNGRIMKIQAK